MVSFFFFVCLISAHVQEWTNLQFATVVGDFFLISLFLWTCPEECLTLHRAEMIP